MNVSLNFVLFQQCMLEGVEFHTKHMVDLGGFVLAFLRGLWSSRHPGAGRDLMS